MSTMDVNKQKCRGVEEAPRPRDSLDPFFPSSCPSILLDFSRCSEVQGTRTQYHLDVRNRETTRDERLTTITLRAEAGWS